MMAAVLFIRMETYLKVSVGQEYYYRMILVGHVVSAKLTIIL